METGEVLWEINLGSVVTGFPITYAVDGRQYLAVSTGSASSTSGFIGLTPEIRPSSGHTWRGGRRSTGTSTKTAWRMVLLGSPSTAVAGT